MLFHLQTNVGYFNTLYLLFTGHNIYHICFIVPLMYLNVVHCYSPDSFVSMYEHGIRIMTHRLKGQFISN